MIRLRKYRMEILRTLWDGRASLETHIANLHPKEFVDGTEAALANLLLYKEMNALIGELEKEGRKRASLHADKIQKRRR